MVNLNFFNRPSTTKFYHFPAIESSVTIILGLPIELIPPVQESLK